MPSLNPFQQPGQWYQGNTHSHSTESDGQVSLDERFGMYRENGYDFLVITDHHLVSDVTSYSRDGFLAISGSEVHPPNPYGGDRYHFVAINIHEAIPADKMHPNEAIAAIREQGGLAVLCHPYWCGHTLSDLAPLQGYFAVEVFNATCNGIGKAYGESHWDDLLDTAGPVNGIAADDSHHASRDVFHGWIKVKAPDLSAEAITEALAAGSYYSTQGPELLDLAVGQTEIANPQGENRQVAEVSVKCSPAQSIVFKGQRSRGRRFDAPEGEALTEAIYPVMRGEKYVRVEVTDADGKRAWSNPLYFD